MSSADETRERQRATWDKFSTGWTKWDDLVARWHAPVGAEMIRSLALQPETQHLDIAAGTGEPGLSIASLIPRGRVVLTDLSERMLESASANVETRGLRNVEVRQCGVDDLPFADAAFDSISCRFGFMFFPDIPGAVTELMRVLRPGGQITAAVWAEPPGNSWATIPLTAISSELGTDPPPPDTPGLFRCAPVGAIADVFRAAGLRDVTEVDVHGALEPADLDEYWTFMTEVAAPVVAGLAGADADARERIRTRTLAQAQAFQLNGKLSLPMHARCITGTK